MNLDYTKYKNTKPFPDRKDYTHYNYYYKGEFLGKTTTYKNTVDFPTRTTVEKVFDEVAYYSDHRAYNEEYNRLDKLFKEDVLKELGIENHPKRDILFNIAWEDSHSEGLEAVANRCEELAELLS